MSGGNFAIQYAPSGSVASDIWDDTGNRYLIWGEGSTGIMSINTNMTDNKGTATLSTKRNSGQANLAGFGDLVIEGDRILGNSAPIFLNVYNNGNVLVASGGGKLGVGTVSPTQKLDVRGSGNVFQNISSTSGDNVGQVFQEGLGSIFYLTPTNTFRFDTNGSEKMRITDSGSLSIGTTTPDASALLHIASNTKGVLITRGTTTEINAISSPANGLMVYNTTLNKLCVYENGTWKQVTTTTM